MWSHGRWYCIHQTALMLQDDPAKFTRWMKRNVIPYLECEKCVRHAYIYIHNNVPTDPWIWSVDFHNHVNQETGKDTISESYAYKLLKNGKYPPTIYEGIWRTIHSTACTADDADREFFIWWIPQIIETLPNKTYVRNAKKYLKDIPVASTFDTFLWSYKFHEKMKPATNKPMSMATAVNMWRHKNNAIDCPSCKA